MIFYDIHYFGNCVKIYAQDVHRDMLILTLCHFLLISTNVGMFHLNLVHLHNTKFDKKLRGLERFHVHEQTGGFFLTGGLQSRKYTYKLTK